MSFINDIFSGIIPLLDHVPVLRAIIGSAFMFFVPGYMWVHCFLRHHLNPVEMIAVSLGLSIASVTLILVFMNYILDISLTGAHSLIAILVFSVLPVIIYYVKKLLLKLRRTPVEPADEIDDVQE